MNVLNTLQVSNRPKSIIRNIQIHGLITWHCCNPIYPTKEKNPRTHAHKQSYMSMFS